VSESTYSEIIKLVEYDPIWAIAYQQEKELITTALKQEVTDIQHIGSTAVPGLNAKQIIDILIAVNQLAAAEKYSIHLQTIGYQYIYYTENIDRLFFRKGTPRTHHVHIVEYDSWTYWRHILFRDYLLAHPEIAQQYEQLKREMAIKFKKDRNAYTDSKTEFIQSIVAQALVKQRDCPVRPVAD
jgi:GrpB-like predicted nucleotidyltransferase (UPF0157 family)